MAGVVVVGRGPGAPTSSAAFGTLSDGSRRRALELQAEALLAAGSHGSGGRWRARRRCRLTSGSLGSSCAGHGLERRRDAVPDPLVRSLRALRWGWRDPCGGFSLALVPAGGGLHNGLAAVAGTLLHRPEEPGCLRRRRRVLCHRGHCDAGSRFRRLLLVCAPAGAARRAWRAESGQDRRRGGLRTCRADAVGAARVLPARLRRVHDKADWRIGRGHCLVERSTS
mmetsp:Transcript_23102/g.87394  ORF Transcript_23102/g.87394 Transcript_23102/m.87394 type:complete len:225 (-) Transcript_23102:4474-5148(-)